MLKIIDYEKLLQSFGLLALKTIAYKNTMSLEKEYDKINNYNLKSINKVNNIAVDKNRFNTPVYDKLILDTTGDNFETALVLIDVKMSKNIVKTAIQGLSGTVKEFISEGDYMISIKGLIVGDDALYPAEEVKKLLKIYKKNETIRVNSRLLQMLQIDDIVIESGGIKDVEGFTNVVAFEFECVSDELTEIVLSNV